MTDVTVALFNRKREILAVEVSVFRQDPKKTWPFIGDKQTFAIIDLIN